jgi:hypothetical protein
VLTSIDCFLDRSYNAQTYNCLHFSREVWLALTGRDIGAALQGLLGRVSERGISRGTVAAFARLASPMSPCIVLLQRPRTSPHMGVYLRGKVLHITQQGVEFLPVDLAMRGFKSVRFYSLSEKSCK